MLPWQLPCLKQMTLQGVAAGTARLAQRKKHYLYESVLQKVAREAVQKAGISRPASPYTFCHSFSVLARHSVLDTESSRALWIPASAGMTNSR
jgi:hypothetical protein